MENTQILQKTEIDYSKKMTYNWLFALDDILKSEYMSNLMGYIECIYKDSSFVYPKKGRNHLFKPFDTLDIHDIRVVFVGDEPPANIYSNNIGPGVTFKTERTTELNKIKACIINSYGQKSGVEFDNTLEPWLAQGVFYLNSSLISSFGTKNKHHTFFKHFTRSVITAISDTLVDVVFVFTNAELAKEYKKYVSNTYHHVIISDNFAVNSEVFIQIDELLEMVDTNNKNPIKW